MQLNAAFLAAVLCFGAPACAARPAGHEIDEARKAAWNVAEREGFRTSDAEAVCDSENSAWEEWARLRSGGRAVADYPTDPALRQALTTCAYWAVYFRPKEPGFDGDLWVFLRRSDLALLGVIRS